MLMFLGEPDKQLNPKKKVWESVAPDLTVDAQGVAVFRGDNKLVVTSAKSGAVLGSPCAQTLRNVQVK